MVETVEFLFDVFSEADHLLVPFDVSVFEAGDVTIDKEADQRKDEESNSHSAGGD